METSQDFEEPSQDVKDLIEKKNNIYKKIYEMEAHIVSLKKQSICTIDNQGQFKQYNLDEGSKLTHRGEAPFKIQLNPSISELYFQGWKVILNENDTFIQLNPFQMATESN